MEYTEKALDILETARRLFSKKGFKAVTTKEIAKKANVNEVTIFRQFQTKERLFEQVISQTIFKPKVSEYINNNEPDIERYLTGIGNLIHTIFTQNIDLFRIELMEQEILKGRKIIAKFPNEIKNNLSGYLTAMHGYDKHSAETFAVSYMSAIHGLCFNIYLMETFDPKPDFNQCLKFLIRKIQ